MHTHIHTHAYAHVCTDRKSQQQRLNVSSNIIAAHTHPYAYTCIYTRIYIYTYVHNLQRVCSQMCTLVPKHTCVTYTPAHALVPKIPVKCMQHSLQKNAHIYIPTHICIRIHMHTNTHTHGNSYSEALRIRTIKISKSQYTQEHEKSQTEHRQSHIRDVAEDP